jgi:hypothetical protein
MAHADRFRALLAHLGLSHPEAAKLLHVSLRTLQNWLSGHHAVPYTAYKLLRLMRYMELPGPSWAGWHFSQGQLVTPEGRTISGKDGAWWSLLVRQAHGFGELYKRFNSLSVHRPGAAGGPVAQRGRTTAPDAEPLGGEVAVTPHFSPLQWTPEPSAVDFTPSQVSYRTPVFSPKKPHQEPRS